MMLQALRTVTPFATVTVRPHRASAEQIQGQHVRNQALLDNARLAKLTRRITAADVNFYTMLHAVNNAEIRRMSLGPILVR